MKLNKFHFFLIIILLLAIVTIAFKFFDIGKQRQYDDFAQCINDTEAQLFGAFWCPSCVEQLDIFADSKRLLPYVECSTPDSKGQTVECIDAGIKSYPTWDFADGTRVNGVQTLTELAGATGCTLPLQ